MRANVASVAVPWRPLSLGLVAVGSGLLAAVALGVLTPWPVVAAGFGYLIGAGVIGARWHRSRFGAANTVTLARVVGCCWVGALTVEAALGGLTDGDRLLMIGVATGCLILDGVDGWVARARSEVSAFGARFDMETDAVLLVCLCLAVPILGVAGWWVLALSGMRYGHLAASQFSAALRIPLPVDYARKVVAVIATVAPIAALTIDLVWPGWPAGVILSVGLACLTWSFARDIVWQIRVARSGTPLPFPHLG